MGRLVEGNDGLSDHVAPKDCLRACFDLIDDGVETHGEIEHVAVLEWSPLEFLSE